MFESGTKAFGLVFLGLGKEGMNDWVVGLGFPFGSLVLGVGVEGEGEVVVIDWVGRIIVWFVGVLDLWMGMLDVCCAVPHGGLFEGCLD